jgi:hypothetical protein
MLPLAVSISLQSASADVFTIDRDNSAGSLCSVASPCGTVTVTGTSTLHVVISMNSPFGVFGNNDTFGFNVNGPTSGVSMSNFSNSNFDGSGGSGNEDGWGTFNFRVDGPGGSGAVSTLSFDVTRTGTPFTGPSDIEAGGSGGTGSTIFALHVRNNSSGLTGYAGVDAMVSAVPEPGSVLLLGTVLSAVGFGWKRGWKKRS